MLIMRIMTEKLWFKVKASERAVDYCFRPRIDGSVDRSIDRSVGHSHQLSLNVRIIEGSKRLKNMSEAGFGPSSLTRLRSKISSFFFPLFFSLDFLSFFSFYYY